ncbi:MAG TPA: hypothetical protein VKE22_20545 [Haliangiales bacterium]|nr:hypothetical protein [Haliangiales bacterium]
MDNNTDKKTDSSDFEREGLLALAGGLVERALSASFGAANDVYAEVRTLLSATFDYGETVSKSVLRLGRKLGERAVDFGADAALRGERATRGLVAAVRTGGSDAIDAAAQALTATAPAKSPVPQRAKA